MSVTAVVHIQIGTLRPVKDSISSWHYQNRNLQGQVLVGGLSSLDTLPQRRSWGFSPFVSHSTSLSHWDKQSPLPHVPNHNVLSHHNSENNRANQPFLNPLKLIKNQLFLIECVWHRNGNLTNNDLCCFLFLSLL